MGDYSAAAIVLVVCAGLSLLIAQNRHASSPWAWGLVGLILGPIGLIFTVIAAKGAPNPTIGAADQLARLQAARDGGLLTPEQYQAQAAALAVATAPLPTNQAGPDMRCGRCGKPLSPAWVGRCLHCKASYAEYPPVARTA